MTGLFDWYKRRVKLKAGADPDPLNQNSTGLFDINQGVKQKAPGIVDPDPFIENWTTDTPDMPTGWPFRDNTKRSYYDPYEMWFNPNAFKNAKDVVEHPISQQVIQSTKNAAGFVPYASGKAVDTAVNVGKKTIDAYTDNVRPLGVEAIDDTVEGIKNIYGNVTDAISDKFSNTRWGPGNVGQGYYENSTATVPTVEPFDMAKVGQPPGAPGFAGQPFGPGGPTLEQLDNIIAENEVIADAAAENGDTVTQQKAEQNIQAAEQQKQQIENINVPPLPEGRDRMVTAPTYEQFENAPRIPVSMRQDSQPIAQNALPYNNNIAYNDNVPRQGIMGVIDSLKNITNDIQKNPGFNQALFDFGQRIAADNPTEYQQTGFDRFGSLLGAGVNAFNENLIDTEQFADDPNAIPRIQQLMTTGINAQEATSIYLAEKAEQEALQEQRDYDKTILEDERRYKEEQAEKAKRLVTDKEIASRIRVANLLNSRYNLNVDPSNIGTEAYDKGAVDDARERLNEFEATTNGLTRLRDIVKHISPGTFGSVDQARNYIGKWLKNQTVENVQLTRAQAAVRDQILASQAGAKTDDDAARALNVIDVTSLDKDGALTVLNNDIAYNQSQMAKWGKKYVLAKGDGKNAYYIMGELDIPENSPDSNVNQTTTNVIQTKRVK